MTEVARSLPDIVEELLHEFESVVAMSTVSAVVIRLSRDAQLTVAAVSELARTELAAIAATVPTAP